MIKHATILRLLLQKECSEVYLLLIKEISNNSRIIFISSINIEETDLAIT